MKNYLIIIFITLLILTSSESSSIQNKSLNKGNQKMNQSILKDKPSFNLKISADNAYFEINVNGVQQIEDFSELPIDLNYPLNGYITNGENEISVLLSDTKKNNAKFTVTLFVRKFNDFTTPSQDILTLSYDQSKQEPFELTTKAGHYSEKNNFLPSSDGKVIIGVPNIIIHKKSVIWNRDAKLITLKFSFPNPFPRWKYLDGEEILAEPYRTLTETKAIELQKNDAKIQALYAINREIYNAAKKKDIYTLMSFFKERNREMDTAYYRKEGETATKLRDSLLEVMNNPNMELLERNDKVWEEKTSLIFRVEENNKLAYVVNLLTWNYTKGEGSENFEIRFRYEKGKWILTR